jgi:hypothetical protein
MASAASEFAPDEPDDVGAQDVNGTTSFPAVFDAAPRPPLFYPSVPPPTAHNHDDDDGDDAYRPPASLHGSDDREHDLGRPHAPTSLWSRMVRSAPAHTLLWGSSPVLTGAPLHRTVWQATPLLIGLGLAVGVVGARSAVAAYRAFQAMPKTTTMRAFYKGGFEDKMSKREAALILGVRCVSLALARGAGAGPVSR